VTASIDGEARFGANVRQLRSERGWSLRDLAERICFHRGYLGKVEQGQRFPDRRFAELADVELDAGGDLIALWDAENDSREEAQGVGRLLVASTADSLRLIESPDEGDIAALAEESFALAVEYLGSPPGPMLLRAVEIRSHLLKRLNSGNYRASELSDLYMALGAVQGVLTYAALDLGDSVVALTHASAAWTCGDRIGSNELMAWTRGTESLIMRFDANYTEALRLAVDGLRLPVRGTGRLRLLSGVAQCHANLGDSLGANAALDRALIERQELRTEDPIDGLFTFSRAKQHYYAGSSLMWLENRKDLERAAREAEKAVRLWEAEPPETRSLDDEALARIYAATAHTKLGAVDAAREAVGPVLALPEDRRISWIVKRLGGVADELDRRFPRSAEARDLSDEVRQVSG
jgi:transcriptional regulator with XRE-family HTH domain